MPRARFIVGMYTNLQYVVNIEWLRLQFSCCFELVWFGLYFLGACAMHYFLPLLSVAKKVNTLFKYALNLNEIVLNIHPYKKKITRAGYLC